MKIHRISCWAWMLVGCIAISVTADDAATKKKQQATRAAEEKSDEQAAPSDEKAAEVPDEVDTKGMVALTPDGGVWIDKKRKWVVLDGKVCLQRGTLEMFACPKETKEHESIIATDGKPSVVHAGLIAVGAKPGQPSTFVPEYRPVSGPEIDIWVLWKDADGNAKKVRAQEWVRNVKTGKQMDQPWIFGGSKIWRHPTTGEGHYQGDGGDFICVSNFPTATMDIPIPSSDSDQGLLFEAFTERIPDPGTRVRLVLVPKIDDEMEKEKEE